MSATDLDELGPVDFAVIEFPAGKRELHRRNGGRARDGWLKPS